MLQNYYKFSTLTTFCRKILLTSTIQRNLTDKQSVKNRTANSGLAIVQILWNRRKKRNRININPSFSDVCTIAKPRNVGSNFTAENGNMTQKEIENKISLVENIGGMTVNERLYVCGLDKEFEKALKNDKLKAERILELLKVDKLSIELILKK